MKTNPKQTQNKPNFINYFERGILFTRTEAQSTERKYKPALAIKLTISALRLLLTFCEVVCETLINRSRI